MVAWNPSSPRLLGLELARLDPANAVVDGAHAQGFRFRAAATGAVDSVRLFCDGGSSAGPGGPGVVQRHVLAEVVPLGSEAHGAIASVDFACNAVVSSLYATPVPGAETAVACLATPGDGKTLRLEAPHGAVPYASFQAEFASAGFADGNQVLAVQFVISHSQHLELLPRVYPAGTGQLESAFASFQGAFPAFAIADYGEARQDTAGTVLGPWQVWNPAEVREFDAGTRRLYVQQPLYFPAVDIDQLVMRVWYCPERRLACGMAAPVADTWVSFPLSTPTARAAWSRTSGVDYTVIVRRPVAWGHRPHADATLNWRVGAGGAAPLDPLQRRGPIPLGDRPGHLSQPTGAADLTDLPLARLVAAGADLPESVPYLAGWGAAIWAGQTTEQRIEVPDTTARPLVYAWVSVDARNEADAANATLTVSLHRVSDGVSVASGTVSAADVLASLVTSPGLGGAGANGVQAVTYRRVRIDLGAFALSAQDYNLRFTVAGGSRDAPWLIGLANATNTAGGITAPMTASYGGTTRGATGVLNAGGADFAVVGDLAAVLSVRPAAPSSVAATVGPLTIADAVLDCGAAPGCHVSSLQAVAISWTYNAGLLVGEFLRVEVERHDAASGWAPIAALPDAAVLRVIDEEARIGVPTTYRVRNVRTDGATSDWVTTSPVTLASTSTGAELLFTSNADLSLAVAAHDVGRSTPDRAYSFPEADERTLVALYGRDYRVAFRPLERRGEAFDRLLLLHSGPSPAAPTLDVFDPLRDLARAAIPYVCVRDTEGNRWLASIAVPDGSVGRVAHRYVAKVAVVEVTATPALVAVANGSALGLPAAPAAPTAVRGPSSGTVALTWVAPASPTGPITGYSIRAYVSGVLQSTTAVGVVTAHTLGGLTNGTAYTFRVAALSFLGLGPYSPDSVPATPATLPGAPTIGTATAAPASATVTWTAPASNGGSAITGYLIDAYQGATLVSQTAAPSSPGTVPGLTPAVAYTFKVAAINAVGAGPLSAASNSATPTAVFDPTTNADLILLLSGDRITGKVDGNALPSWTNSMPGSPVGAPAQATGGAQPTYKTGILNGKAVVRFDGADGLLTPAFTAIPSPLTIFVVANRTAAGPIGGSTMLGHYEVAGGEQNQVVKTTGTNLEARNGANATHAGSIADGTWFIAQARWKAGAGGIVMRRDGGAAVTATGLARSYDELGIGALFIAGSINQAFPGDIAEVLVYDADLSLSDLDQIGNYLAGKYGLTWAPAS